MVGSFFDMELDSTTLTVVKLLLPYSEDMLITKEAENNATKRVTKMMLIAKPITIPALSFFSFVFQIVLDK